MANKYIIEIEDGIIKVRFIENPSADDICDSLDDAARITPGNLRLWDYTCGADLTNGDIEKVASHAKSNNMQSGKVAIVAPQDLTYGVFRVYIAHREEDRIQLAAFRTEEKAVEWLKEPST